MKIKTLLSTTMMVGAFILHSQAWGANLNQCRSKCLQGGKATCVAPRQAQECVSFCSGLTEPDAMHAARVCKVLAGAGAKNLAERTALLAAENNNVMAAPAATAPVATTSSTSSTKPAATAGATLPPPPPPMAGVGAPAATAGATLPPPPPPMAGAGAPAAGAALPPPPPPLAGAGMPASTKIVKPLPQLPAQASPYQPIPAQKESTGTAEEAELRKNAAALSKPSTQSTKSGVPNLKTMTPEEALASFGTGSSTQSSTGTSGSGSAPVARPSNETRLTPAEEAKRKAEDAEYLGLMRRETYLNNQEYELEHKLGQAKKVNDQAQVASLNKELDDIHRRQKELQVEFDNNPLYKAHEKRFGFHS